MPKKKVKKMSKEEKTQYSRQVRHLEALIKYSRRAISKHGSSIDEFFENQANKLEQELREFKNSRK